MAANWVPRQVMDAHFDAKRFPADAVDYLESQNAQGPLFGPDYWGGYLIYRLYPRVRWWSMTATISTANNF